MFKKTPPKGSSVATAQWTTQGGGTVTLGQLDHEHISNIYWVLRVGQDMKYNARKVPSVDEIAFVSALHVFIMQKFGHIGAYLPRTGEEATQLKKGNYIDANNNIVLHGQLVGNLSKLGYAVGPLVAPAQVKAASPGIVPPIGLTTDFDRYTLHPSSRAISRRRVEELKESLLRVNWLAGEPITVDEQGRIISGQHRFIAAKELGLAFRVVLAGKLETTGSTTTNSASSKFLASANINMPGLRRQIGAQVVAKIETLEQPAPLTLDEARAVGQKNVDTAFGLVPISAGATPEAIANLLNKSGISRPSTAPKFKDNMPHLVPKVGPQADMSEVLESRAVMTWSALKLHLNIGDREPLNSEALDLIRKAIQLTYQQATA